VSVVARARFDDLIEQHAADVGVSPDLVRAVIQAESGFNPWAISRKGALGLMQLMPATARELGVTNPFHPDENIRGGVTYLAQLLKRYDQNVQLALAAYNAGPGAVERYGNAVPPYRETRDYVKKITAKSGAAAAAPAPPAKPNPVIYKWTEVVDGEHKVRYSNFPPSGVDYEAVGRR
jgi:soluble lytic murein transglycosylase-like protein